MKNELTIDVGRPAAAVFSFIEDARKLPLWLSGFVATSSTDVAPREHVGTFRQIMDFGGRFLRMEGTVLACEPAHHLAYALKSSFADVRVDYRLEDQGASTRLHYSCETGLKGLVRRLFTPVLHWALQRKINGDLNRLKQVVEAGA